MVPDSVFKIFRTIQGAIKKFFTSETLKKVDAVGEQIKDVLVFALPAVEEIAKMTKNTDLDDKAVAIIKQLMLDTPVPPSGKLDEATRQGVLMYAAGLVTRNKISDALRIAGQDGIKIGGQIVKDQTDIPDSVVNAATNILYSVLKNATKAS